jgi:predicted RNA-binding Zn-ribbon protein involved in translation (DUF1610 family)
MISICARCIAPYYPTVCDLPVRIEKRKEKCMGTPTRADDRSTTSCITIQKISIMASRRKSKKIVRHWKPQIGREIKMLPATVIFSCPKCGRRYDISVSKEDIPLAKFHCPHDREECDKIPISKESHL